VGGEGCTVADIDHDIVAVLHLALHAAWHISMQLVLITGVTVCTLVMTGLPATFLVWLT